MGRKKRQPTKMVRIRVTEVNRLKVLAKLHNLSLGDYISKLSKRIKL